MHLSQFCSFFQAGPRGAARRGALAATVALAALSAACSGARASVTIDTYPTNSVLPSASAKSTVDLTGLQAPSVRADSPIDLYFLYFEPKSSSVTPDPFDAYYRLRIALRDDRTGQVGVMFFDGRVQGTISTTSANLSHQVEGASNQSVVLGGMEYFVRITGFTPPGAPGSGQLGILKANVYTYPLGTTQYNVGHVASALRIAAGLAVASDLERVYYDRATNPGTAGRVDMADVALLMMKVGGMSPNP